MKNVFLTHRGRVTQLTTIGSENGFSPGRRQAIIWTNARKLLIRPLGTKSNGIFYQNSYSLIQENPFQNVVWKIAAILPGLMARCVILMTIHEAENYIWLSAFSPG